VILCLLLNILLLRRRFRPLEQLVEHLEGVDPTDPATPLPATGRGTPLEIDRLGAAFHRLLERIEAERRRSGALVLRAQEEERKRLARDLHDEVNQALTAILLRLEAAAQAASPDVRDELGEIKRLTNQAMSELLQLARQLRPTALDDHGLAAALHAQVRHFSLGTGVDARLTTHGDPAALPDDQQLVIYRVAQEALANVSRHARARNVQMELQAEPGSEVMLAVRDDGCGFDPEREHAGLGLGGMAERARLVGADLELESAPGAGSPVSVRAACSCASGSRASNKP